MNKKGEPAAVNVAATDRVSPGTLESRIIVTLTAGPRSLAEIEDAFRAYGRRLPGAPGRAGGRGTVAGPGRDLSGALARALDQAVEAGRATHQEGPAGTEGRVRQSGHGGEDAGGRFALTAAGRARADRLLADLRSRRGRVHRLLRPSAAATASVASQLVITGIKIPAALISGSAAQLNDAAEELADLVASAAVYLGVRHNAERLANLVVIALMAIAGTLTLALAIRRLAAPAAPAVSWYPLVVAATSVPVYAIRSAYERGAGLRGGSESLVSQSVDSRNHALAGLAVTIGLVSVILHAPVIDTVIGLALALTILKSCAGLVRGLIRAIRDGREPELARYSLWATDRLERMVRARIGTWLLHMVGTGQVTSRDGLLRRAVTAADPDLNPLLREYGMEIDVSGMVEPVLDGLIERGLLSGTEPLALTGTGRRRLAGGRGALAPRPARPFPVEKEFK